MNNANQPSFPAIVPDGDQKKDGLTKRELIAAMAMQGMVAAITKVRTDGSDIIRNLPADVAELSRLYADALLKELDKPLTPKQ